MAGPIDLSKLTRFFTKEPAAAFLIEGTAETGDSHYLGQIGIHKRNDTFRMGYFFKLSESSRFWMLPMSDEDVGFDGLAILFRQFDSSRFQEEPQDYLAGWVPLAMAPRAEEWVETFNGYVQEHLARRSAPER